MPVPVLNPHNQLEFKYYLRMCMLYENIQVVITRFNWELTGSRRTLSSNESTPRDVEADGAPVLTVSTD